MVLQLQLQRNEVIALINLLNRLSESIKFIHEMGPAVEAVTHGQISAGSAEACRWKRFWSSLRLGRFTCLVVPWHRSCHQQKQGVGSWEL